MEKMDPKIAWDRYGKLIYLNESQYKKYVTTSPISGKNRKMKPISIFILKLEKFKNPIKSSYLLTPAGQYISEAEYHAIKKESL